MRRARPVVTYLMVVFGGAGLLAPWVWRAAGAWAQAFPDGPVPGWVDHPFHRYTHRCLLGLAVIGAVPLARALGIRHWHQLGWASAGEALRHGWRGVAWGTLMAAVIVGGEFLLGVRVLKEIAGVPEIVRILAAAVLAAVAVGTIEEVLFRGVFCGGLRTWVGWRPAMALSSGIYAVVHFLQRPPEPEVVTWYTGWVTVGRMLIPKHLTGAWGMSFAVLFLAGYVLATAYRKSGTLLLPMGLHGGWVFWLKLRLNGTQVSSTWAGAQTIPDGAVSGLLVLVVLVGILAWWESSWRLENHSHGEMKRMSE